MQRAPVCYSYSVVSSPSRWIPHILLQVFESFYLFVTCLLFFLQSYGVQASHHRPSTRHLHFVHPRQQVPRRSATCCCRCSAGLPIPASSAPLLSLRRGPHVRTLQRRQQASASTVSARVACTRRRRYIRLPILECANHLYNRSKKPPGNTVDAVPRLWPGKYEEG